MIANVTFYLKDNPRVWFETHEAEVASWDLCKTGIEVIFMKPVGLKMLAQKTTCIAGSHNNQGILSLCKRVDVAMTEKAKVGHILKGIADDAF